MQREFIRGEESDEHILVGGGVIGWPKDWGREAMR